MSEEKKYAEEFDRIVEDAEKNSSKKRHGISRSYFAKSENEEDSKRKERVYNINRGIRYYSKGKEETKMRSSSEKISYLMSQLTSSGVRPDNLPYEKKAEMLGTANELLSYGKREGNLDYINASLGAYAALGRVNDGVRKKAIEGIKNAGKYNPKQLQNKSMIKAIRRSLEAKSEKEKSLEGRLKEKELIIAGSVIAFIFGAIFLSTNMTGNVIGNLDNNLSGLIGFVLITLGIVGIWFFNKKRNKNL